MDMETFFKALKAGAKGGWDALTESQRPLRYVVAGRPVRCPHCSGETFMRGNNQMNTRGAEFVGLGWVNASATTMVCAECGYIQWFAQDPEVVE